MLENGECLNVLIWFIGECIKKFFDFVLDIVSFWNILREEIGLIII